MTARLRAYVRQHHVGLIALAIAVIGVPTAWAVARNTVGSAQLKPNAVKESDIANDAVTGPKIADGSLTDDDFKAGELVPGPQGPQGPQGQPGTTGQAGEDGTETVARPSGNTTISTGGGFVHIAYPLSNNTWTQASGESNLVTVRVALSPPSAGCSSPVGSDTAVEILIDGQYAGQLVTDSGSTGDIPLIGLGPPPANQDRTLTAQIYDTCDGAQNGSVSSIAAQVTALR